MIARRKAEAVTVTEAFHTQSGQGQGQEHLSRRRLISQDGKRNRWCSRALALPTTQRILRVTLGGPKAVLVARREAPNR